MSKATILLVDDRRENLSVLVDVLSRASFRVLVAEDGAAGVAQARRVLPDVILLDIAMPVLDGYGCCQQLKEDEATRDIPVVFVSARHETVDRVRGYAVGGVDHITKPFRAEEVMARVTAWAQLSRQGRAIRQAKLLLERAAATTTDETTAALVREVVDLLP